VSFHPQNRHADDMVRAMSRAEHLLGTQLRKTRFYFGGGRSNVRKIHMRKTLIALSAAAALTATAASPVLANQHHRHHHNAWVAPAVGAGVGTVVGFGLYEGWFGTNALTTSTLANSAAGAATGGFIAGVGTVALIHAATTPCQGFAAIFGASGCANGQYVGDRVVRRR
jgi:hypothetical protein